MKSFTVSIFALLYAIMTIAGNLLVLCDGGEGHKEIEVVHHEGSHCDHDDSHSSPKHVEIHHDGCSPCDDTYFSNDEPLQRNIVQVEETNGTRETNFIKSIINNFSFVRVQPETRRYNAFTSHNNSKITSLRTVILLI